MSPNCKLRVSSYLFPFIILASGFPIGSGFPRSSYEESSPAVVTLSNVRRENAQSDKQVYDVTVRAFEEDIPLKLVPSRSPFAPDLRVFQSSNEGDIVREVYFDKRDLGSELKFYTDITRSASLVIEDDGSSLFLEGILNDDYRIVAPKRNLESRDSRDQSMTHVVFRRKRDILTSKHNCKGKVATRDTTRSVNSAVRLRERQDQVTYTAEVFLVLDYETTKYFDFDIEEIAKYYGVFYNEVQRFYDNLVEPSIKIVITSIHLTMSIFQERFLERVKWYFCFRFNRVDYDKTLDLFGAWLYKNQETFGNYDLAILSTGLDMGTYGFLCEWSGDTNGIAYIATACYLDNEKRISYKSGVSEDIPGTYVGMGIHAHEIGHILGCTHDEVPPVLENQPSAETCPWSDGFVMSYVFGTKNKFYFSTCSVSQMKWYVAESGFSDCLLDQPQPTAIFYNTQLPGQIKTLDEQCQYTFGGRQYYHEAIPGVDVCTQLNCRTRTDQDGDSMGPAFEGSPCGFQMICLKGVCANATG